MKKHLTGPTGFDPNAKPCGVHRRHVLDGDRWLIVESDRYMHWPDSDLSFWYEDRDERVIGEGVTQTDAWRDCDRRRQAVKAGPAIETGGVR